MLRLGLFCLLLAITITKALGADDSQSSLNNINHTIAKIKSELQKDTQKKNQLALLLKETEVSIGTIDKDLAMLGNQIKKEKKALALLNQKESAYEEKLKIQQKALSDELKTLYLLHSNNYAQTLLNQQNTASFSRNITYFKYFNQSRLQYMQAINQTMDEIKKNQVPLSKQTHSLEKVIQDKLTKQQQLTQLLQQRHTILTSLNSEISTKQQKLSTLEKNKARLQQLIQDLSEATQTPIQPPLPFYKMKGKLIWPTKGKLTSHFGEQIDHSQLTTTGVIIAAPKGEYVRAIYPGKVIFADWLKGFGLLLIIDHGDGYLSLYGRNNSLYHKVGDFVNEEDIIANVGNSGGFNQSGLYFEIRKDGNPLDPVGWCH